MYIDRLQLERFRGTRSLPLDLNNRLNVFVGMNGAGKSSVLDATAILLSWLVNRVKSSGASGRPILESDIRNGDSTANIGITVKSTDGYFNWNIVKARRGHHRKDMVSILISATEYAKQMQTKIAEHHGQVDLPLCAYYPVNRAVLDIPLRIRAKHSFDLLSAYDESLTSGANFRTFFEWFREREDLENENRRYASELVKPEGYEYPDRQLETVRGALALFMPEFTDLTVRRNPLRMEVKKSGEALTVNQLSDGEKCLMAIVGDLARRMAIANPTKLHPLEGDGVIMIDEVDLHLHPKWQRMILSKLLEVFPNCQFLVSTHSPHVITHVKPENIFLLNMTSDGLQAIRPVESYGKTVDRVLEDLMGLDTTRPDKVTETIRTIYTKIDSGDLNGARSSIAALEQEIGDDPELVKANVLIKRKELIGK